MLSRSTESGKAALKLLELGMYDACVVAFYYSVLQRMIYALVTTDKNPLQYSDFKCSNENVHVKAKQEILNRISNRKSAESFDEKFTQLYQFRIKADYSNTHSTQDDALDCRQINDSLMSEIKRYFPAR